ncbi:MAG: hypothetical protein R3B48_03605 [Kofleriaceae bacterium]
MMPAPPSHSRAPARRRAARAAWLLAVFSLSACLPSTYEIHRAELARLAATPPELRGARVEIEQEIVGTELESAQPVGGSTQVVAVGSFHSGPRPGAGGHGPSSGGSKVKDARSAAIAMLVLATFGVVLAAAVEARRFEGTAQLHPMHPVHLFGRDGGYAIVPLAQLDGAAVAWSERALIRASEGPLLLLERAPLRRRGLTYGVSVGVTQIPSADGTNQHGTLGLLNFGYFPSQHLGAVATAAFAWRENVVGYTVYEQRYGAELQFMPLAVAIFHAGGYVGGGLSWRLEEGFSRGNDRGLFGGGGLQVQIDASTHIALTARGGVHSDGELLREFTFGMSVY